MEKYIQWEHTSYSHQVVGSRIGSYHAKRKDEMYNMEKMRETRPVVWDTSLGGGGGEQCRSRGRQTPGRGEDRDRKLM